MIRPNIIAISGGSGSGKSHLARSLYQRVISEAVHLTLDDFYHDQSHLAAKDRDLLNFDHPQAIDWQAVDDAVSGLLAGNTVAIPRYDFATHSRSSNGKIITPARWVLIEGLWPLTSQIIRSKAALRVFIDCPADVRLARRISRDVLERGRSEESVRRQFLDHVLPMHDLYVQPYKELSDVVLHQDFSDREVEQLLDQVNRYKT